MPQASPKDTDNIPLDTSKAQICRMGLDDTSEATTYEQSRRYALHSVVPLSNQDDEELCWQFATLRSGNGGIVEVYETSGLNPKNVGSFHKVATINNLFPSNCLNISRPIGIFCCKKGDNEMLFATDSYGNLTGISIDFESDEDGGPLKILHQQNVLSSAKNKDIYENKESLKGMQLSAFTATRDGALLAFGGQDRETFIWDVEKQTSSWRGRNLPPDPQTLLQQPVWGTALQFIGPGLSRSKDTDSGSNNVLAVGSAYKELRIYDVRVQRRPVAHTKEGIIENRVSSICALNDSGFNLAVGDSTGDVHNIDLRKMEAVGRFVGPGGSVRQIIRHDSQPIIACVSLDRMLRIYDIASRRMISKVYLKQRLNCCTFAPSSFLDGPTNTEKMESVGTWEEGDAYMRDNVEAYVNSSDSEESDDDESLMEVGDEFRESESSSEEEEEEDEGDDDGESTSGESDKNIGTNSDESSVDEDKVGKENAKKKRHRAK